MKLGIAAVALKCPFCGSEDVRPCGTSNVKSGTGVIIRYIHVKHFKLNTPITAVNTM
jgi:hypothetical protein